MVSAQSAPSETPGGPATLAISGPPEIAQGRLATAAGGWKNPLKLGAGALAGAAGGTARIALHTWQQQPFEPWSGAVPGRARWAQHRGHAGARLRPPAVAELQ
jgi:hypothetical protein